MRRQAETAGFLPHNKDRRWAGRKDEQVLAGAIPQNPASQDHIGGSLTEFIGDLPYDVGMLRSELTRYMRNLDVRSVRA